MIEIRPRCDLYDDDERMIGYVTEAGAVFHGLGLSDGHYRMLPVPDLLAAAEAARISAELIAAMRERLGAGR